MSITAILTLYKRPQNLIEQLTSIQNQSILPENIVIWINHVDCINLPTIPDKLNKNLIIINSSKNFGVWARFTVGLLFNSKYICVFDDDTIPGKDWFKNCTETILITRGLLGTIGIRFDKGYNYKSKRRYGWDGNNENIEQVDIVGHCWFFERKWLSYLWNFEPDYNLMIRGGEDIAFSYELQKQGINTYVPPHPNNNKNLWGSIKGFEYGIDNSAISCNENDIKIIHNLLKYFINLGFNTINNNTSIFNNRSINNTIKIFNGGWSYTNKEMEDLFKNINTNINHENYNILEFGGGDSSKKILKIFEKTSNINYYVYESNKSYIVNYDKIKTIVYDENNIETIDLDLNLKNIIFNLVLIDGPNGEKRKYWYSKLKKYVKNGTIILVDDFNHYKSFSDELDKNFEYELLGFHDEPFVPYGEHSWKIIKVIKPIET